MPGSQTMTDDKPQRGFVANSRRRLAEKRGRSAERLAEMWLRLKGYRILARRARTPLGEIDLVAAKGKTLLVFIEVKARDRLDPALEAVTPQLRQRLSDAARLWAGQRRDMDGRFWRFDVMAITPGRMPHHLRDAWRPDS